MSANVNLPLFFLKLASVYLFSYSICRKSSKDFLFCWIFLFAYLIEPDGNFTDFLSQTISFWILSILFIWILEKKFKNLIDSRFKIEIYIIASVTFTFSLRFCEHFIKAFLITIPAPYCCLVPSLVPFWFPFPFPVAQTLQCLWNIPQLRELACLTTAKPIQNNQPSKTCKLTSR